MSRVSEVFGNVDVITFTYSLRQDVDNRTIRTDGEGHWHITTGPNYFAWSSATPPAGWDQSKAINEEFTYVSERDMSEYE